MKSIAFMLLVLSSMASSAFADSRAIGLTSEERAWLSQHPAISMGTMNSWPPLNFTDNSGKPQGIGSAYIEALNRRLGGAIVIYPAPFKENYDKVRKGELDALMDITSRPDREALFNFTRPYVTVSHVLVGRKEGGYFNSEADLSGKTVALERGFYNVTHFRKNFPEVIVREYGSTSEALDAVARGEAAAYAGNRAVAVHLIEKELFNNLHLMGRLQEPKSVLQIGTGKDKALLASILDKALSSISEEEQNAIQAKWTPVKYEKGINYPLLLKVVSISLLMLSLFGWWILRLAKEIRIRKQAEEKLSNYREQLEIMVQERSQALADSEKFLDSIIENIPNMIFVKDADDLKFVKFNRAGEQLLGIPRAELIGKNDYDFFPKREADYFTARDRDVLTSGQGIDIPEEPIQTMTGPRILHTRKFPILEQDGTPRYLVGISEDITEREKDLKALDYANECFQQALNSTQHILYRLNVKKGCYDYLSPVFERITGHPVATFMGTSLEKLQGYFHPEDRERVFGLIKEKMSSASGSGFNLDIEYRLRKADDSYCWLHDSNTACLDDQGELECFFGAAQDITERKQTEELLKESEERYRLLVEQSAAWIWKTDAAMRHTFSNDNVERILGYSAAELCAMDILKLVHPEDHEKLIRVAGEAASASLGWSGLVLRWKTRDGAWRSIESSGMPLFDEEGNFIGLQGTDTDITDRLQLEQEREKGQRLESLGLLAGGIAHDFNNILTGIVGNLSLARMMIDSGHRAAGRLGECEKAAKRASELTQQLLTFARGGEPVKKSVEVSRLINEAVSFGLRGSNVKAVLELDEGLWSVDADEGQLNQVFNNLLINATQAMPDGGIVTVSGENIIADNPAGMPQRFVRLTIRDTGCGIPLDALSKVFDPYFTTKVHGSGLGLASVHSIVTRHGGTVNVSSEIGRGTEFVICLPAAEKNAASERDSASAIFAGSTAARILVMDDEAMIVEVVSIMLDELGCTCDTCSDGAEAVKLYQAAVDEGKRYDVVILDLTVPGGMGGLEAGRRILDIDPGAALVVSSGYSHDAVIAEYADHGFCGSVMKPYTMEVLNEELGRVLMMRGGDKHEING